jgi:UDP-glucuronate 4-epimerase
MAITLFTRNLLCRRPVVVLGDGSMSRDYTHVDDIVRGTIAAAEHVPAGFRAYNLGSAAPVDLRTLVGAIAESAGVAPILESAPRPLGDVDATFADVTRARVELQWEPRIRLREGLATVVRWVRETLPEK